MLVSVIYCKCNYKCCCSTAGVSLPLGAVCAEMIRKKKKKEKSPSQKQLFNLLLLLIFPLSGRAVELMDQMTGT